RTSWMSWSWETQAVKNGMLIKLVNIVMKALLHSPPRPARICMTQDQAEKGLQICKLSSQWEAMFPFNFTAYSRSDGSDVSSGLAQPCGGAWHPGRGAVARRR